MRLAIVLAIKNVVKKLSPARCEKQRRLAAALLCACRAIMLVRITQGNAPRTTTAQQGQQKKFNVKRELKTVCKNTVKKVQVKT